jgi:NAD(P)-dependent dehydrogenase (short-subunit alcohol dehydrogenase family)
MKTLEGKVAVITGGSSGIGLATAKLFQQAGAKIAISGRNQKALDAAAKELGADTLVVRSDVSKLSDPALFLASGASSDVTGVELNVDGGLGQV